MHIVYFFTYGYSLETWSKAGILNREIKLFKELIKKHNLKFTIITYGNEADLTFDLDKNINIVPIYTLIKKSKNKFINLFNSFFLSKKIDKKIDNFDVIKQNQLLGSWVSILFKLRSRKPLYTRTGYDMFLFSLKEKKSIFKVILYYLLTQTTLYFSNLYTITSTQDRNFLSKYFIVNKNKLVKRSNWVENIHDNKFMERKSKTILTVGRLEKQKNYEYLIKSLVDTDFSLDIVGAGSNKDSLQAMAKNCSVQINFLGILKNEDLLKLYTKYKYFVSSSLFEGNPKAILEAMSSGCIVIARDIPNNSEIIKNHKNGILFNEENSLNNILKNIEKIENLEEISRDSIVHIKVFNSIDKLSDDIYSDFIYMNKVR